MLSLVFLILFFYQGAARRLKSPIALGEDSMTHGRESSKLLGELAAHFRQNRARLRQEWVGRIYAMELLEGMTEEAIFADVAIYDSYVEALETESFDALQVCVRNLSERMTLRGAQAHEAVGIVLLLRDVLARSLFAKYQGDSHKLSCILDAYEPAANRVAKAVAVGFVRERELVIRQQQEAIRQIATTLDPELRPLRPC